jgi:hypothetical protein
MHRALKIGLIVAVLGGVAVAGLRMARGPSGASSSFGGNLEATALPDFPSLAPEHWVNGAPTSLASLRGSVVLIEAWAPG